MTLGDERVALLDTLADVLLVEAARELQQVVGVRGVEVAGVAAREGRRCSGHRGGCCGSRGRIGHRLGCLRLRRALQLRDAGVGGDEALAQLLVLLVQAAQLDDDLVEEVVNFVLVVALTELRRLKPFVDYIFRSQCH